MFGVWSRKDLTLKQLETFVGLVEGQ